MAITTSPTTMRNSPLQKRGPFVARVEKIAGQKLLACYQCGKCSAGCPMAAHMDVLPNQIIRLAQLGMQERLMASSAIWTCVSCLTCNSRCPKGIRIAEIIEALRGMAIGLRRRDDHLDIRDISLETRGVLPPIALISAMRKQTS
ncbi:MAG: 4Fe-4S dicluster domain-containing protein [Sulfuritalea sp.]|nr:4Fe-4S dicluster domain-containing protein [Sulfuritalea sp.]